MLPSGPASPCNSRAWSTYRLTRIKYSVGDVEWLEPPYPSNTIWWERRGNTSSGVTLRLTAAKRRKGCRGPGMARVGDGGAGPRGGDLSSPTGAAGDGGVAPHVLEGHGEMASKR